MLASADAQTLTAATYSAWIQQLLNLLLPLGVILLQAAQFDFDLLVVSLLCLKVLRRKGMFLQQVPVDKKVHRHKIITSQLQCLSNKPAEYKSRQN